MMEYPRLVYRCPGPESLPGGKSYASLLVGDPDSMSAALVEGWFSSVPEALEGKVKAPVEASVRPTEEPSRDPLDHEEDPIVEPDPLDHDGDGKKGGSLPQSERDDPPTRAELEQKAKELHIKFDGRTTNHSLAEKIERALK